LQQGELFPPTTVTIPPEDCSPNEVVAMESKLAQHVAVVSSFIVWMEGESCIHQKMMHQGFTKQLHT
jgi:hypothetical protein